MPRKPSAFTAAGSAVATCWMRTINRRETMSQKLYEVHVEFTYYAMSESRMGAKSLCSDAFQDEDWGSITDAHEVTSANQHLEYTGDYLVYGADDDTTLDSALASIGLPSAAEIKAAWVAKMTTASRQAYNITNQQIRST